MFKAIKEAFMQGYNNAKYSMVTAQQAASIVAGVVRTSGLDIEVVLTDVAPPAPGTVAAVNVDEKHRIYVYSQSFATDSTLQYLAQRSGIRITTLVAVIAAHELGHAVDPHMGELVERRTNAYLAVVGKHKDSITVSMIDEFHKYTIQMEHNAYMLGMPFTKHIKEYKRFNDDNMAMYINKHKEDMQIFS